MQHRRRHRDPVAQFRGFLYGLAKFLGDVQAVRHHHVARRIKRRMAGKFFGRIIGRIR